MKRKTGETMMDSLSLTPQQRAEIARKKTTCPFIGPAVKTGALAVLNSSERPMARIEEVAHLGDMGGGDLGRHVLSIFARGNHNRLPDANGKFEAQTPEGLFSLDFPGSQGAHAGDSDILLDDPDLLDSGRFSPADFERLARHADNNGMLTMSAVGAFIAENLARDDAAKVLPVGQITRDLGSVFDEIGDSILAILNPNRMREEEQTLVEKLTKLAGEDNLVGSAGEFGLLFAFFANRPKNATQSNVDGIPITDVKLMMSDMEFPEGWDTWPKHASDWVHATLTIAFSAIKARRNMA
jgi:hypothetical protein